MDLSHLGDLQPVETLDLENYADNKVSTFQLPQAGRYTLQAPSQFEPTSFSRTKTTKAISAQIDPIIAGPTNEGFQIRFVKVSATNFKRDGVTVSQLGDYLRATGYRGSLSTEAELIDAVTATAGSVYTADIEWRAFSNKGGSNFVVEGMRNFPKLADGTYQSWVSHPTAKDAETGEPLKVRANLVIDRYVPAV